ncbi:MAG: hypothetical protein ACYS8K_11220 [Planctomycetota bacterium]|jgi:hypothetical protein
MRGNGIIAALLVGALAAGCGAFERRPQEPQRTSIVYKRVAIVGFYDRTPYTHTAERFTEHLRARLAERTTSTDVIVVPREALPALGDPFLGGRISLDVLVELRTRYLADAVVIGSVDGHDPYWQPSVHITLKVIDTASGAFPHELSEGWDAREEGVRHQIDDYWRRNRGKDDCRFGPELFVTSPSYFLKFVADQVAQRLTAAL